jgi:cyclohexyl-isocyanide hydratase
MAECTDDTHLNLGAVLFPDLDQADFTGPFEVLSRLPNSTFHILAAEERPIKDSQGLMLMPQRLFSQAPPLDVLLVPGGTGVNVAMENETVLAFIRQQAVNAKFVMSVCTGALLCGAAGLLKGRRATTHWASHHMLQYFGAIPVDARVVVDGSLVSTAGVTAGFDGALRLTALLRGEKVARRIQLHIQYAPEPPFDSGRPETAPPEILEASRQGMAPMLEQRLAVVKRAAQRLGTKPVAS